MTNQNGCVIKCWNEFANHLTYSQEGKMTYVEQFGSKKKNLETTFRLFIE